MQNERQCFCPWLGRDGVTRAAQSGVNALGAASWGLLQEHPPHGHHGGNTEGCFLNPSCCTFVAQVILAAKELEIIQLEELSNIIHAALGCLPAGGSSQFTKFHLQASILIL